MGPTSGGSIGSQGWRVPLLGLTCCTAVPAIQRLCVPAHRDVVVYLTGWHGPGYRRVPTYGGAIGSQGTWDHVLGFALLCSTCSTQRYGSMLWSIVLYLLASSGPDRPGDRLGPTSGGSIGSQGWWDTSYLVLHLLCLMPLTAERHVAQASSSVLDYTGYHIASDPR